MSQNPFENNVQRYESLKVAPIDVISIQSQVLYGSVGNGIGVPALQQHDLQVVGVPSVILGNAPYYKTFHGGAIPDDWFAGFLDDLLARGIMNKARAVLIGYLGKPSQMEILANWLEKLQQLRGDDLFVLIDPVLGDVAEGVYVAPEMAAGYRNTLLKHAHGITPNAFELSVITEQKMATQDETLSVARAHLAKNPRTKWIVATSAAPNSWKNNEIGVMAITKEDFFSFSHPAFSVAPKGTGDLFSATLLAHLLQGAALNKAAQQAAQQVIAALTFTAQQNYAELQMAPQK